MSSIQHQSGRFLSGAIFPALLLAFSVTAKAETWTLELKQLKSPNNSPDNSSTEIPTSDPLYFYLNYGGSEQSLQSQIGPAGKNHIELPGSEEHEAAFKKIVMKEPAYKSDYPFRGVAELGTKKFAFALDAVPQEPKTESKAPEEKQSKSVTEKTSPKKLFGYNRLYFDFNGNGDMTDDRVVSIDTNLGAEVGSGVDWASFEFPVIEVALDAEGTKFNLPFHISGYINVNEDVRYVTVSLRTSAYREGEMLLEGKKHRIVLIDSNNNGRFDDATSIMPDTSPDGQLYVREGDSLLLDVPAPKKEVFSRWDRDLEECRCRISKFVPIDGRYYSLKISPTGDKISLDPVELQTGNITNPNDGFSAIIYGDQGFLKISGNKDTLVSVPVGGWKLLSYKIDRTKIEAAEKKDKKPEKPKQSIFLALGKSLAVAGGGMISPFPRRNDTCVEAQATSTYKEVEVRQGETVALPFGPPYKPQVSVGFFNDANKTAHLTLSIIGSAGEVCSNLEVKGDRPSKPEFSITDPQGKVVIKGAFEYG